MLPPGNLVLDQRSVRLRQLRKSNTKGYLLFSLSSQMIFPPSI
jgi:hypothetical protein